MDTARVAEMMRATLSEDKNERDAAEDQLKQVKQYHVLSMKIVKFIGFIRKNGCTKYISPK